MRKIRKARETINQIRLQANDLMEKAEKDDKDTSIRVIFCCQQVLVYAQILEGIIDRMEDVCGDNNYFSNEIFMLFLKSTDRCNDFLNRIYIDCQNEESTIEISLSRLIVDHYDLLTTISVKMTSKDSGGLWS